MSEPLSAVHAAEPVWSGKRISEPTPLINLCHVAEQALQQYTGAIRQGQLIARCENLPHVSGNEEDFRQLFRLVFLLVLRQGSENKQYLHIDCCENEAEPEEEIPMAEVSHRKTYCIEFKSNYKPEISVHGAHAEILDSCHEILSKYNATLQILCVDNDGCMLRLLLQGKLI